MSRENRSLQKTLLSENNQARLPDVSGLVGKRTKRLREDMGKHSNIFLKMHQPNEKNQGMVYREKSRKSLKTRLV